MAAKKQGHRFKSNLLVEPISTVYFIVVLSKIERYQVQKKFYFDKNVIFKAGKKNSTLLLNIFI